MAALIKHENELKAPQAKVTGRARRTRQARNPQLSVARRNERERNRVKMVNNGFALLRRHLPLEDLLACEQSMGAGSADSDAKSAGKARKISKVQTLRAACQRIRALHEIIRSVEPDFDFSFAGSMAPAPASSYDDEAGPMSCASSGGHSNSLAASFEGPPSSAPTTSETFIKLEPSPRSQNQNQIQISHQFQQPAAINTITTSNQQQQQQQSSQVAMSADQHLNQHNQPSHTHLWIQQHQSSFIEHQQQYLEQHTSAWYQADQSPEASGWYAQSASPEQHTHSHPHNQHQLHHNQQHHHQHHQNQHNHHQHHQNQQHTHQQQHQMHPNSEQQSPVWFNGVGAASSPPSQPAGLQQQQLHQISLYSQ